MGKSNNNDVALYVEVNTLVDKGLTQYQKEVGLKNKSEAVRTILNRFLTDGGFINHGE